MEFPPFRIDREQGRLWRAGEVVPLRRKAWEVLLYLVGRPGELVTKDDLLSAVWGNNAVQEAVITNCISELRRALADDWRAPRFIEVVHRRGFRWIATGADEKPSPRSGSAPAAQVPSDAPRGSFVGRELELQSLSATWEAALAERRQVVFISGEPGIGKTTLVEEFLKRLAVTRLAVTGSEKIISSPNRQPPNRLAASPDANRLTPTPATPYLLRGQCLELLGAEEPYLPVLDAIARLGADSHNADVLEVLRRCAPTWIAQMPWLLEGEAARAVERIAAGATQERMLRELATALDAIASHRALILVLEDLHWADHATLDLLSFLARRDGKIRMLVIGTYRAADAIVQRSPLIALKQELLNQNRAMELALDHLSETAVKEYLDRRFARHDLSPFLAAMICRHTDGHPMFTSAVVDELVQRGALIERDGRWQATAALAELELGLPASLKKMLDCQIERLEADDILLLEAASVAGIEFSSQELAGALEREGEHIEDQCERLARRQQFVRAVGWREWPDGSNGERYAFIHGLHQRAFYQRLPEGRRRRLHQRIGNRLELGYQTRPAEVAIELAAHFEQAGDLERCTKYLIVSGRTALRRANPKVAHARFTRALEMIAPMATGPRRLRREVEARSGLAAALQYSHGLNDPEIRDAFERVETLCQDLNQSEAAALTFEVLYSAWGYRFARADVARAATLADRLEVVGRSLPGDAGQLCACTAQGATQMMRGDLPAAAASFESAFRTQESGDEWAAILHYIPRIQALGFASQVDWLRGDVARASQRSAQATELARALNHPLSEMFTLDNKLLLAVCARNEAMVAAHSDALALLSERDGVPLFIALAGLYRNWLRARAADANALAELEMTAAMTQAIGYEWSVAGIEWLRTDALIGAARFEQAVAVIDANLARIDATGARFFEAEMYRQRGEVLAHLAPKALPNHEAEQSLRRAISIAEKQDARWWELRARTSLIRLRSDTSDCADQRRALGSLCERFSHVSDTHDVREASQLLA